MRHRLRSAICIALVALAGIVVVGSGCSNQGEGERCTFVGNNANNSTNGTQDCQDGLVCESGGSFPPATGTYDRCCPTTITTSTIQACKTGGTLGGSSSSGRDASFVDSASDAKSDGKDEDATKADAKTDDVEKEDAEIDAEPADAAQLDAALPDAALPDAALLDVAIDAPVDASAD